MIKKFIIIFIEILFVYYLPPLNFSKKLIKIINKSYIDLAPPFQKVDVDQNDTSLAPPF